MTAIFAYVEGRTCFVASDSVRSAWLLTHNMATKTTRWSDKILITQTGSALALARLVAHMCIIRDQAHGNISFASLLGIFGSLQQKHYRWERKKAKGAAVAGTIIVAAAEDGSQPATIATLDFASGAQNTIGVNRVFHADGTDQPGFDAIARNEYAQHTSLPIQLDVWGEQCILKATTHPTVAGTGCVGWPADFFISREYQGFGRKTVISRRSGPGSVVDPQFVCAP